MLHASIAGLLIVLLSVPVGLLLRPSELAERWSLPTSNSRTIRLLAFAASVVIAILGIIALNA